MLGVGDQFEGYTVEKVLGRGTFGVVYEVIDYDFDTRALKVFDPLSNIQLPREELVRRFSREVRYQSAIDHRNVVKITSYDLDHDPPYFVMEMAQCSLLDLLREKKIGSHNAVSVIADILAGLEAMHEAGYKHRDLKPANVLAFETDEEDADFRFAISDFGLIAPPESDTSTLTATGVGGGTIDYAAPEAMKSLRHVTVRSDIYSVGAILHDIYVGQRRIPCTKLTGPGLLGPVIEKCTETNQSRRFANVSELREAFVEAALAEQFEANERDADIIELLQKDNLTAEEWDSVDIRIQERDGDSQSEDSYAIFRSLKLSHLDDLSTNHLGVFFSVARALTSHVFNWEGGFPFAYCDVVADKLNAIFKAGDVELKALALAALLILGTSHNRFYVEGIFGALAGPNLEDAIAQRFITECEARSYDLEAQITQWERSISTNRDKLHSAIQDACE